MSTHLAAKPIKRRRNHRALGKDHRTQAELHLMMLPGTISMIIFSTRYTHLIP